MAAERGEKVRAAIITKVDYDAMVADGMDAKEIAHEVLERAGAAAAVSLSHLKAQYPNLGSE